MPSPCRKPTFFLVVLAALSINAELLLTDAQSLFAFAKTDIDVCAALAVLGNVNMDISATIAEKFSLYDSSTGQGNIIELWMKDRSETVLLHKSLIY